MKQANRTATACKIIPFRSQTGYACPYRKDRQYYLGKLTDYLLAALTCTGALTALLFFLML